MSPRLFEMCLVFIGLMTALGCATGVLITIIRRWGNRPLSAPDLTRQLTEISERLSRLEPAIDSMAVEVERISEAQRFTAKILAERAIQPDRPPRLVGSTTPH